MLGKLGVGQLFPRDVSEKGLVLGAQNKTQAHNLLMSKMR